MIYDCTNCKHRHYLKDSVFNCEDCKRPICVQCVMGSGYSQIHKNRSTVCPTCHVVTVVEALRRDLAYIPLEAIYNITDDGNYCGDTMPDVFLNLNIGVTVRSA